MHTWLSKRTWDFNSRLHTLPLAEQAAIRAAENAYAEGHSSRLEAAQRVFSESLRGYEDRPAGKTQPPTFLLIVDRDGGDWSWKPLRNEAFPQFEMPAYKPARHPLEGIRF